jgi:hypothetical protein
VVVFDNRKKTLEFVKNQQAQEEAFRQRKKPDGGWPDGYHTDRGDADALADALAAEEAEKIG